MEYLPYEEGIKTDSIDEFDFHPGLEYLPYEEGIKTPDPITFDPMIPVGVPTL